MTDDFPELPDFDPKAAKQAVRRGILRTVSIVLSIILTLAVLATAGSRLVQERGDRGKRMTEVLGTAFKLYNPAYRLAGGTCCETTPLSMSFRMEGTPVRAHGGFNALGGDTYTITQNFFGRVGHLPLGHPANTRLSFSLYNVGGTLAPKEEVTKVLARLPQDLNALAVVEFARPLTEPELVAFTGRHGGCPSRVVYERRTGSLPITWSTGDWDYGDVKETACGIDLKEFRKWVGILRDHDDANLRSFDLSLARLRKAADAGLAYAYVDDLVSIERLRTIIADPLVRTVRLADVAFDLDRP
ncbi:hypothetical protein HII36_34615 [Nonomuraea sp. NN258]|uniref:hypothetical protein n=1 Tax=Nonomuraea antri TaxID=2730852 RepID=UPI001569D5D7|nr:hypothetical protein [Nonomuraea antri]NRQ36934.1 hypothetical protein [Nonomuraea antri]